MGDSTNEQPRDGGRFSTSYTADLFIEAIKNLGGSAGRSEIQEKIEDESENENWSPPSYKTTQNWLEKLADQGKIKKERIGSGKTSSIRWYIEKNSKERLLELVNSLGAAETKAYARQLDDLDSEEVDELLHELEGEGKVSFKLIGDAKIWMPKD